VEWSCCKQEKRVIFILRCFYTFLDLEVGKCAITSLQCSVSWVGNLNGLLHTLMLIFRHPMSMWFFS
jgi:hypothetical protein